MLLQPKFFQATMRTRLTQHAVSRGSLGSSRFFAGVAVLT